MPKAKKPYIKSATLNRKKFIERAKAGQAKKAASKRGPSPKSATQKANVKAIQKAGTASVRKALSGKEKLNKVARAGMGVTAAITLIRTANKMAAVERKAAGTKKRTAGIKSRQATRAKRNRR